MVVEQLIHHTHLCIWNISVQNTLDILFYKYIVSEDIIKKRTCINMNMKDKGGLQGTIEIKKADGSVIKLKLTSEDKHLGENKDECISLTSDTDSEPDR